MQNKIKFILSLIGAFAVIGASLSFLLGGKIPFQDEKYISMCVDQFNTVKYRQIKDNIYCQNNEYEWHRLENK